MESNFVALMALASVRLTAAFDQDCSTNPVITCMSPVMSYVVSDEGKALLGALGQNPVSVGTLSDDQMMQACVAFTNMGPCLLHQYTKCSTAANLEITLMLTRTAQLVKKCQNPGVGAKARKLLTCTAQLTSASSKYVECSNASLATIGLFQLVTDVASPEQVDQQVRTTLHNLCCAEERRYTCSIDEVRRVCGIEAAGIYDDLRAAMTEAMNCRDCSPMSVTAAKKQYGLTNSASQKGWMVFLLGVATFFISAG